MSASTIHYRLDLAVRLIDTTTGAAVDERDVRFEKNGQAVRPDPRGSGDYVFINSGREDHILTIRAYGYDVYRIPVRYGELDERMPLAEAFLLPSENTARGQPVITFSGKLPGLESVQAVDFYSAGCSVSSFDTRRCIMTLFKTFRSDLDDVHYGLIHPEDETFEPFDIEKKVTEDSVKLKRQLEKPFAANSPIGRVIFGYVEPDGEYRVKVRDDRVQRKYLIRYVVNGEERFKTVDFRNPDGTSLD